MHATLRTTPKLTAQAQLGPPFSVNQALTSMCIAFTGFILLAIIAGGVPQQSIDDLGLFNPIYVWLTTGHWAYPIALQFDGMSVHPPFRYMEIAILMWAGVPLSVALAIMPALFTGLAIYFLFLLEWSPEIKIATCLALMSSWLVMYQLGESIRPDAEVTIIWVAGLFALEYACERRWPRGATAFAGALITYASVMHYFGSLAFLGGACYLVPIWWRSGFRKTLPTAAAMAVGGACVLLPYLIFYIVPHWRNYQYIFDMAQSSLSNSSFWKDQFDLYAGLANTLAVNDQLPPWILRGPTMVGIPPFVIGFIGFAAWPSARQFGAATLPMVLFVLVLSRKWESYLFPEYFATVLGFLLLIFAGSWFVGAAFVRLVRFHVPPVLLSVAAFMCCTYFVFHPVRIARTAVAGVQAPKFLEEDVARAAAIRAIGGGQLVGGRLGLWYVSGAARWYDIEADLYSGDNTKTDLASYFKPFDYIVEDGFTSDVKSFNTPRAALSTWYGDGLLFLRGFYLGTNFVISYVRLSARPGAVIGHVYSSGVLSEFRESVLGSAAFATLFCQAQRHELASPSPQITIQHILLPIGGGAKLAGVGPGQQELILAYSKDGNDLIKTIAELPGCVAKQIIRGSSTDLDLAKVLPLARYDRNVMDFSLMRTWKARQEAQFRPTIPQ